MKKFISLLTATAMMSVMLFNSGIAAVLAETDISDPVTTSDTLPAPGNLRVELMEDAYGIDTLDPSFSWSMNQNDGEKNIMQEGYRILITNAADTQIVDSGWIAGSESAYAKAGANITGKLEWNSLYYWQVQVKDNTGRESGLSEKKAFTTAMDDGRPQDDLNATGWADITGIWHDTTASSDLNAWEKAGWTDYTIEMDMYVEGCIGIVFRQQDGAGNGWYYMWQIKSNGPTVTSSPNSVVPHINGSNVGAVDLSKRDITITPSTLTSVKIELNSNTITTYIKNTNGDYVQVDQRTDSAYSYGYIGFRTGGNEEGGTIDSLKVTKTGTDEVLYEDDFTSNQDVWPDLTISNGQLSVPKGFTGGTHISSSVLGEEEEIEEKGNYMFARHAFELTQAELDSIDKAVVSFAAKSTEPTRQYVGNLYMNGEFVGLSASHFGKTADQTGILWYTNFDVTDLLSAGENVIGAINYTTSEKQFLVQMTVHYKDGTSAVLVNSGRDYQEWKTLDGTAIYGEGHDINSGNNYFTAHAEYINAAKFPFGWNEAGFDDTAWTMPALGSAMVGSYEFRPYDSENTKRWYTSDEPDVYETTITKNSKGNYVVDLGREIVGGVKLDVDLPGTSSQTITMYLGEEMNSDGETVKYNMLTGNTYYQHWTLKPGEQSLENIGMMTFRYIEIENWPEEAGELTTDHICGVAMYQEFDGSKSDFDSSDDFMNQLYDVMKYTIQVTNQDVMVDSQSRERDAYEGDILINMMSGYSFSDNYSLARHSFEKTNTARTWPLEYAMFAILMTYYDYMYTGNTDSMAEFYDVLEVRFTSNYTHGQSGVSFNSLLVDMGDGTMLMKQAKSTNNQTDATIVDWPTTEQDGYEYSSAYYNAVGNAVCYAAYEYMGIIADILGKDGSYYTGTAEKLKAGFIKYFYDEDEGAVRDGLTSSFQPIDHYAQHATAYALCYGLYEDFDAAESMVSYIREQGEIKMSVYGSFFLLSGLYNTDVASAGDTAYELMTSTGTRSWHNMIYNGGATITSEAWHSSLKSNMTYSHPWGSAPGSQIVQGLFGIQPLEAAFSKFQYQFQIGDLEYASIKTPSLKGSIEASFDTRGASPFEAEISIPANTTAQVMIPDMGYSTLETLVIDGTEIKVERDGNYLTVELGSGDYTITLGVTGQLVVEYDQNKTYVGQTEQIAVSYSDSDYTVDKVTFVSSNENVATVTADGLVTIVGTGSTAITVTATVSNANGTQHTITDTITINGQEPFYSDFYIDISGNLYEGKTAAATVIGVLETGDEMEIDSADIAFSSLDTTVFTVDSNGTLTGVMAGESALLEAVFAKIPNLAADFDISKITYGEVYHENDFSTNDHGMNMFNGSVSVSNGVLIAGGGARGWYNGTGATTWTDYTLKAEFKITSDAASFTFRHTNASSFYLWQVKNDDGAYLKTHVFQSGRTDGYTLLGMIPFDSSLLYDTDWNEIVIRAEGNTFSTYLNGTLIDVTSDDTWTSGSIGVRNGSAESFQINSWSVEEHRLALETEITVLADDIPAPAPDKNQLREAVADANTIKQNEDKYVSDGWDTFLTALSEAEKVLANENVTEADIQSALENLETARTALRLKADKSALQEAVEDAREAISSGKYTDASINGLEEILKDAQAMLDDETLSEDDQDSIDNMVLLVKSTIEGMDKKDDSSGGDSNSSDSNSSDSNSSDSNSSDSNSSDSNSSDSSGSDSSGGDSSTPDDDDTTNSGSLGNSSGGANTGDSSSITGLIILLVLLAAAGVVVIILKKKRG